jgi:predicted AlkP superfamily pyrophosphatase or phosphodiesterase
MAYFNNAYFNKELTMNRRLQSFLLLFLLLFPASLFAADTPKSLTIMLDGCRPDVLLMGHKPNFDALRNGTWAAGYRGAWSFSAHTIKDADTASAANHTAIATGVTTAKDNVPNNGSFAEYNTTGASAKYPTFLTRIKQQYPDKKTVFLASWGPDKILAAKNNPCDLFWFKADTFNAKQIVSIINGTYQNENWTKGTDPDAILWYIDEPDHVGHSGGFSPPGPKHQQYIACLDEIDTWLGNALEAIKQRPNFANESWQIIITSDHGGWLNSHGAMSADRYTVPLIVSSKTVKQGELRGQPCNADTAPTVLDHYSIDVAALKKEGLIDGSVRGQDVLPAVSGRALVPAEKTLPLTTDDSFTIAFQLEIPAPIEDTLLSLGKGLQLASKPEGEGNSLSLRLTDEHGTSSDLKWIYITPKAPWTIVVTVDRTGNAVWYAKAPDGNVFFFSQSLIDENLGKSFGRLTGKLELVPVKQYSGVKDLRFWNRALRLEEVKKLLDK